MDTHSSAVWGTARAGPRRRSPPLVHLFVGAVRGQHVRALVEAEEEEEEERVLTPIICEP